jgi:hypothetical protein
LMLLFFSSRKNLVWFFLKIKIISHFRCTTRLFYVFLVEALLVDDLSAVLVVLGLEDPLALEGGEGGENGTTDPDGVLTLRGSDDAGLEAGGTSALELLGEALGHTVEHGGTTGEDDVGEEILADVDIALGDGLGDEGGVAVTIAETDEVGLEEGLRAAEALRLDGDDGGIGELELSLDGLVVLLLHLFVEVEGDVAGLFLDVADDFLLGRGGEGGATFHKELHHVLSEVATGKIDTADGVRHGETFVDGDGVGDTITGVEDDTGGAASGVEGEDGLDADVHAGAVEGLEHDLGHLLAVDLRVHGGLSEEDVVLFGVDAELVVEGVVPDEFHVVPVGDDTVLDGVGDGEDTTAGLGVITDEVVLLSGTKHGLSGGGLGATDDGGEDDAGSIVTGETGLDHTGTVVADNIASIFVTHFDVDEVFFLLNEKVYGKRSF